MSIQRISVGAGGVQGNGGSSTGNTNTFTADGRYLIFQSSASNLVSQDTNGQLDIFRLDRQTGIVDRISTTAAGIEGNGSSFSGSISADGRFVIFRSQAPDLTGVAEHTMVVRKDLVTGAIDVATQEANADTRSGFGPIISSDGRYAAYATPGGNGTRQVVRYDFETHTTSVANTFPDGNAQIGIATGSPTMSGDGRYVAFFSDVAFASGDGNPVVNGVGYDIFVKDMLTGAITRASNSFANPTQNPNGDNYSPSISLDGRFVVFQSYASNISSTLDTNGTRDIVRIDLQSGNAELVDTAADGTLAGPGTGSEEAHSSANGRFVTFVSAATNLVAGDTNGVDDVFVKDMLNGHIMRLSVAADGTEGNAKSYSPTISADGRIVTFASDATNLVAGDTNGVSDVFMVDLAESGFWQGVEKVGGNVQVNTQANGAQYNTSTIALNDDRFLITWTDTSTQKLNGQFFDETGTKSGTEFMIMQSSSTGYDSGYIKLAGGEILIYQNTAPNFGKLIGADGSVPSDFVARPMDANGYFYTTALPNGGFVVSYSAHGYVDIGVQAYDALGQKVGNPFFVASGTYNEFVNKEVIAFADGSYGLLYDQVSTGLFLQRFDAAGNAVGSANAVSASTADIGIHSQIDAVLLSNGNAFATWSQGGMIHGRFFDSHGALLGSDVVLSPSSPSGQNWPHASVTTEGHIAVAWTVGGTLYAKMLASDGSDISQATVLSSSVAIGWVVYPTVLPNGGVLYTWRGQDGSGEGAEACMIDGNGAIVSNELLINTMTAGNQYGEQAAVNSQGVVLATFGDGNGADGSSFGVFTQVLTLNGMDHTPPACFLAGTLIRTPAGETAVERLAIGDRVMTADGRALPVRFIGRQTIVTRFADPLTAHPVCIAAGALGPDLPARDLYTSPGHAMLLDDTLVIAGALVNGSTVTRMARPPERFTYFHVELGEHAVIFANGAATETFCDNVPREIFDNGAEHAALYPGALPIIQLDLPTVKSARQLPEALRQRLAAQARALGHATNDARSAA